MWLVYNGSQLLGSFESIERAKEFYLTINGSYFDCLTITKEK